MGQSQWKYAGRAVTFAASAGVLVATLWAGQMGVAQSTTEPAGSVAFEGPSLDVSRIKLTVFTMIGCGHCKNFKKELASIIETYPKLSIEVVEYAPGRNDAKSRAAQARIGLAQIQGFPTTLILIDGQQEGKVAGYRPAKEFLHELDLRLKAHDTKIVSRG